MKTRDDTVLKIQKYLLEHEAEMLDFLKSIVSIESPSNSVPEVNSLMKRLEAELKALDYYTLRMPGKNTAGYLYARPSSRSRHKPLQLLVGHCDTVWPLGTIDHFSLDQKDDRLKGPGVYDMKAGITQILFAIRAIKKMHLEMSVVPLILINSDEEIGSHESTLILKRLARISNRAFVMEPPLGLDGKLKTARKGIGRFSLTVKGRAAHAGLDPAKGINAIVELSYLVQRLFEMNDLEKGITVNIGMIEGGISANVVAPSSKAVIDVRVENEEDGINITKQIKNLKPHLPDTILKIEGGIGRPPMQKTKRNEALWIEAIQQGERIGLNLQDASVGGGSDANTTSLYTATLDGLGTPGDGAHADHEFVFYDQIKERTALLTLLLLTEELKR